MFLCLCWDSFGRVCSCACAVFDILCLYIFGMLRFLWYDSLFFFWYVPVAQICFYILVGIEFLCCSPLKILCVRELSFPLVYLYVWICVCCPSAIHILYKHSMRCAWCVSGVSSCQATFLLNLSKNKKRTIILLFTFFWKRVSSEVIEGGTVTQVTHTLQN
jgi:hypothetical protein